MSKRHIDELIEAAVKNSAKKLTENTTRINGFAQWIYADSGPPRTMHDDLVEWSHRAADPLAYWPIAHDDDWY